MIEFDKLQWTEEPPRVRRSGMANAGRLGLRICVYDPKQRGAPHARVYVPQPDIAAALRRKPVRFMTAMSEEHNTRAMAFELCSASGYEFVGGARGDTVHVSFGLFAWMNPVVAAYPITQWAWDGQRLIILLPRDIQQDVAYTPQIKHVPNALLEHKPEAEVTFQADTAPVPDRIVGRRVTPAQVTRALAGYAAADNYPANPSQEQLDAAIAEGARTYDALAAAHPDPEPEPDADTAIESAEEQVVELLTRDEPVAGAFSELAALHARRGRPKGKPRAPEPVDRERTNDGADARVFKPRELSAAEREAASVQILRPRKRTAPINLPPRTTARPETPATRLQAGCRFLQLDVGFEPADTGAMCNTTVGSMWLNYAQMRVLMLMVRNVESGYGATGLSELHNARFRPGDQDKALASLGDTEAWLSAFAEQLTKQVGIAFRVEDRLYALDAAQQ